MGVELRDTPGLQRLLRCHQSFAPQRVQAISMRDSRSL
jgi:hypothetical protein